MTAPSPPELGELPTRLQRWWSARSGVSGEGRMGIAHRLSPSGQSVPAEVSSVAPAPAMESLNHSDHPDEMSWPTP